MMYRCDSCGCYLDPNEAAFAMSAGKKLSVEAGKRRL